MRQRHNHFTLAQFTIKSQLLRTTMMRLTLSILTLLAAAGVHATGKDLDQIITAEADAMLMVQDISSLRAAWREHPLVHDMEQLSLAEWFGPLLSQPGSGGDNAGYQQVLDEFGLNLDSLFELFPGQAGLALYNLSDMLLQKAERPDLVILANFSGSAEQLDALMQIQFKRNAQAQQSVNPAIEHKLIQEQFMGQTLYLDEVFDGEKTYIEDGYALVDGIFILASPAERLRATVESIKTENGQPLARRAAYQQVGEASGQVDARFYLNVEAFAPDLSEELRTQTMPAPMAMFGVSGPSLNTALALEALQAFSLDFKLQAAGVTAHSALIYREKAGLLSLLTYAEGALPQAGFVPVGALSSSVSLFDLSAMFTQLEAILGTASPSAPALLNIQLQQIKTRTGVDLRRALLGNFGTEIVSFSILPEAAPGENALAVAEQVYVLEIQDAAALSGALEALKDMIPGARGQIQTRDFAGETIHSYSSPANPAMPAAPAISFSYVVTRTHLILCAGQVGTLQSVLTAMQSGDSGFWQSAAIQPLVEQFEKKAAVARAYTDLGQAMESLFKTMESIRQLSANADAHTPVKMPELPWHFLAETYSAREGLFSHMMLTRKKDR